MKGEMDMAKCCVVIDKIKSMGTLKARWNHDINEQFRKEHVLNADENLYGQNDILVACEDENGVELSYDEAVRNRIKDLRQADGRKRRKDAVLAYDIVLEFGDADDIEAENIDVDEWEKRSLEWLRETFNIAGDGKNNVISAVCHKDEASPHIHSIVTPVDERGVLCAKSFTNTSAALSHFQDTYAAKLADLGIERGVKGSSAHHKSNRRYNAEKEKAIRDVMPEPKVGQSAMDFYNEYQENLKEFITKEKERNDKTLRNLRAKYDNENRLIKEALNDEIDTLRLHYEKMEFEYKDTIDELKDNINQLNESIQQLEEEKEQLMLGNYDIADLQNAREERNYRDEMIKELNKSHPELVNQYIDICDLMEQEYEEIITNKALDENEINPLEESETYIF